MKGKGGGGNDVGVVCVCVWALQERLKKLEDRVAALTGKGGLFRAKRQMTAIERRLAELERRRRPSDPSAGAPRPHERTPHPPSPVRARARATPPLPPAPHTRAHTSAHPVPYSQRLGGSSERSSRTRMRIGARAFVRQAVEWFLAVCAAAGVGEPEAGEAGRALMEQVTPPPPTRVVPMVSARTRTAGR